MKLCEPHADIFWLSLSEATCANSSQLDIMHLHAHRNVVYISIKSHGFHYAMFLFLSSDMNMHTRKLWISSHAFPYPRKLSITRCSIVCAARNAPSIRSCHLRNQRVILTRPTTTPVHAVRLWRRQDPPGAFPRFRFWHDEKRFKVHVLI